MKYLNEDVDKDGQLTPTRGSRRNGNKSSLLKPPSLLSVLDLGRVRATVEPVSSGSKSMVSKEKAEFMVPELKLWI